MTSSIFSLQEILSIRLSREIPRCILEITDKGGKIYVVGGSVRDEVCDYYDQKLYNQNRDVDLLVTNIDYDVVCTILEKHGKIDVVGKSFGVIIFSNTELGIQPIEIALPRTERSIGVGHKDFVVNYDKDISVEDDLARRDFTFNAMAFCPETKEFIDPFNGERDIKDRIIRCVGKASDRFTEDPLRMLRVIRFSAKLNYVLEYSIEKFILENLHLFETIPDERIRKEFEKVWYDKVQFERFIDLLNKFNISDLFFGQKLKIDKRIYLHHTSRLVKYTVEVVNFEYSSVFLNVENTKRIMPTNSELRIAEFVKKSFENQPPYNIFKNMDDVNKLSRFYWALLINNRIVGAPYIRHLREIPYIPSQLCLNGDSFIKMGFVGKEIGVIQKELLHEIWRGRLYWNEYSILNYLREKYPEKMLEVDTKND